MVGAPDARAKESGLTVVKGGHFWSHLGGTVGFVPKETAPAQGTCWSRTKDATNHNGATLARSLFTPRATFWINPFGLDNPGGLVGGCIHSGEVSA
jgi:hypothetical protein